jgi:heme A synthase
MAAFAWVFSRGTTAAQERSGRHIDSVVHHAHNQRVKLRRTFALVLLGALSLAPCLGVCGGWAAASEARMACCVGMSAEDAMTCCALSEDRQNTDAPIGVVIVALPALQPNTLHIASALAPELPAISAIDSHDAVPDDSSRHVLLSVFLI